SSSSPLRPPPSTSRSPYTTLFRSRNIVDRVVADLISGLKSPQQALRGAVRRLANRGLIALVDSRGRNWSLEGYVGMILRTMSTRSEEHTSELQSRENLVCRLLLEK